eukprot:1735451-Prymnesium_polylepis.2
MRGLGGTSRSELRELVRDRGERRRRDGHAEKTSGHVAKGVSGNVDVMQVLQHTATGSAMTQH